MKITIESQVEDAALVERRREQLVTAAAKCFAQTGYHRTTIKEIAEAAGVSPGLIYTYVKDKEDILFLVILDLLETYLREIPAAVGAIEDPIQRFCASVRAYCEIVGRNVDATLLAYRETKSLPWERRKVVKEMEMRTNKLIADCVEACIAGGHFRAVNVHMVTYRIVLLAHGWALKQWTFRKILSLDQYIEEGLDLFLHALLTKAGWRHLRAARRTPKKPRRPAARSSQVSAGS
jgi:AcrR family transcriptional regulator